MNPITEQVIQFLTHSELPFGAEEDVLLLDDPEALQNRIASLLQSNAAILGEEKSKELKAHLGEADWTQVAQEFHARIELASHFFEADTQGNS